MPLRSLGSPSSIFYGSVRLDPTGLHDLPASGFALSQTFFRSLRNFHACYKVGVQIDNVKRMLRAEIPLRSSPISLWKLRCQYRFDELVVRLISSVFARRAACPRLLLSGHSLRKQVGISLVSSFRIHHCFKIQFMFSFFMSVTQRKTYAVLKIWCHECKPGRTNRRCEPARFRARRCAGRRRRRRRPPRGRRPRSSCTFSADQARCRSVVELKCACECECQSSFIGNERSAL